MKSTRGAAIDSEHLEKETVQVERMIHKCRVHDVPDLQLADLHGSVLIVHLFVDHEIHATAQAVLDAEVHGARRRSGGGGEWSDRSKALGYHCSGRLGRPHLQRSEMLGLPSLDRGPPVIERLDRQLIPSPNGPTA